MCPLKNACRLLYHFIFKTKRRRLTVNALFYAATARFRVKFFAGNRLHRYLGEKDAETGRDEPTPAQLREILVIADKVARVAKRAPWEVNCLVEAMVAQRMLKDSGLCSTLYLGVGRDKARQGTMAAHAWVRCGPYGVCGGDGAGFAVVAKFKF